MLIKELKKEKLQLKIYETVDSLGDDAAAMIEHALRDAIEKKDTANLILATGASQFTFLKKLKKANIAWDKVVVFHLDEYVGMSESHPASFRKYLKERILNDVKPKEAHFLNGDEPDAGQEAMRYENLLRDHEIDIACVGIGENGHIAFNDPDVADFDDPKLVKVADLDEACKKQQLGEGWFASLNEVPDQALSLTIPAIMRCQSLCCVVPGTRKAKIMKDTLTKDISTECPATILREHDHAVVFLDKCSASEMLD